MWHFVMDFHSLLSNQDSNLDWLIQSQMCYHYTIGQSLFLFKSVCKSTPFFAMCKIYFDFFYQAAPICLLLLVFHKNEKRSTA